MSSLSDYIDELAEISSKTNRTKEEEQQRDKLCNIIAVNMNTITDCDNLNKLDLNTIIDLTETFHALCEGRKNTFYYYALLNYFIKLNEIEDYFPQVFATIILFSKLSEGLKIYNMVSEHEELMDNLTVTFPNIVNVCWKCFTFEDVEERIEDPFFNPDSISEFMQKLEKFIQTSDSTFINLCGKGTVQEVSDYLEKDPEAVERCDQYQYPLTYAATHNRTDVIDLLISKSANIDIKNVFGETALIIACKKNNIELVKYLLQKGANVNLGDDISVSPIFVASYYGYIDLAKLLIDNGSDVNLTTIQNKTAIMYACAECHLDIVKLLVENGADLSIKDIKNNSILIWAEYGGDMSIIEFLVDNGLQISNGSNNEMSPFLFALTHRDIEVADYLLQKGASIDPVYEGMTPLMRYCRDPDDFQVAKYLIDKGANLEYKTDSGLTPLHVAIINDNIPAIGYLISKGADLTAKDAKGLSVVFIAMKANCIDSLEYLLDIGFNANFYCDSLSMTPLMFAVVLKSIPMAKIILNHNADVNGITKESMETALFIAVYCQNYEFIDLLLKYGAKINQQNIKGFTALDYAIDNNDTKMINYLAQYGADVNILDLGKFTPLLRAIYKKKEDAA